MSDTIKEAQAQIKEKREHPKTRMNDDRLEKLRQEARQAYQQEEPLTWNTRTLLEICEHAHTMTFLFCAFCKYFSTETDLSPW